MATVQATTIGGKIIKKATWRVKSLANVSVGEVVRLNIAISDEKLTKYLKYLAKAGQNQECVLEREDGEENSVTLGFMVERFTHLLDDGAAEPDIESMAWLRPMNRTVEAVTTFLLERESCDAKFLAVIGAQRKEREEGEEGLKA